ncbi:VWA domain-containing protein [Janibacter terrae]|uniref:VWA domain-containing protein n=1 Tax=Janibacter terrae TaxID=103817 RepID=A0ABZ2FIU5_9MICO
MTVPSATGPAVDELLLGFAHALRAAGVDVTHDRASAFLEAAALVDAGDLAGVRRAARATLCAGPEDLRRLDQVFAGWFSGAEGTPAPSRQGREVTATSPVPVDDDPAEGGDPGEVVRAAASRREVLRHRDVAGLTAEDKVLLDRLIGQLRPRLPERRGTRRAPWRRGEIDVHRTMRTMLRRMGEPSRIDHRRRAARPRRVVVLVDVSGSMRAYADSLLRVAHALVHAPRQGAASRDVEVFTLGTRLTRVTGALSVRDPERALVRAGEQVPDWSGGTRLGEVLRVFLDRPATRHLARGAVVVIVSDGWERGDCRELGEQVARMQRLAHRVVWANPHRGKAGYLPVQAGIVAALPHVDALVAGHSLRSFEELLEVVARA